MAVECELFPGYIEIETVLVGMCTLYIVHSSFQPEQEDNNKQWQQQRKKKT